MLCEHSAFLLVNCDISGAMNTIIIMDRDKSLQMIYRSVNSAWFMETKVISTGMNGYHLNKTIALRVARVNCLDINTEELKLAFIQLLVVHVNRK